MEVEPPPSPLGAGAVCCMCGDRGLPHELLRCKLCCVRLQHRYCSELYPRATAYRRCNWCLAEPTEGGGLQVLARAAAGKTMDKRKAAASADASTSEEEEAEEDKVCRQSHEAARCAIATTRSGRPAAEVKKHKAGDREALPPSPGAAAKKAEERAALPPSPGATAKGNSKQRKAEERAALPPSPGATAKGDSGSNKQKTYERATLPPSPAATAKGSRGNNKQEDDEKLRLPPSPGATAKGDKYNGNKKPMQLAGKLTRPGRVKVRRYKLLAEVISC